MKLLKLLHLLIVLSFIASCNNDPTNNAKIEDHNEPAEKTTEQLRLELKDKENSSPTDYLTGSGFSLKRNKIKDGGFFSDPEYDGYILSGTIKNKATLAKYKDLTIKVGFLSKTNTTIAEESYVIYEFFEPQTAKKISIKINPDITNFEDFKLNIEDASIAE